MRDIIFRGKTFANKGWVFGWFMNNCIIDKETHEVYLVDLDTVTQYVGNTSWTNEKLFEGDLVTVDGAKGKWHPEQPTIAMVLTDSCIIEDGLGRHVGPLYPQDTIEVQKIGNIFDNPELMSDGLKKWVENYFHRNKESDHR